MMADFSNEELLAELGVEVKKEKKAKLTPRQERIIAGFEEIQRFVEEHGHAPRHGEEYDIFERLYAVRLDQIRKQEECRSLVAELDHQNLLDDSEETLIVPTFDNDEELLAELGVEAPKEGDVTYLKHVKSRAEVKAAEEIAKREPCKDFSKFKPIFEAVQRDLESGLRESKLLLKDPKVQKSVEIRKGDLFILFGQKVYVADFSERKEHGYDKNDYRVRLIYDNATESDLLLRSLQKALDRDETARRIIELSAGPLFDDVVDDEDCESGLIYVLRSQSDNPMIAGNREVIHKIGVTNGDVKKRIANAKNESTYLLADVEVVGQYKVYNVNSVKLEALIHKFFANAKLNIEIKDRFGKPVTPREWFLVPLFIIDQVVDKIKEGTLPDYRYDPEAVALVKRDQG